MSKLKLQNEVLVALGSKIVKCYCCQFKWSDCKSGAVSCLCYQEWAPLTSPILNINGPSSIPTTNNKQINKGRSNVTFTASLDDKNKTKSLSWAWARYVVKDRGRLLVEAYLFIHLYIPRPKPWLLIVTYWLI